MKKPSTNPDVAAKPKEESFWAKERRLKARRQTFKMTYRKGVFWQNYHLLKEYLSQPDIIIRTNAEGNMDDGTSFLQITIEGIKPTT